LKGIVKTFLPEKGYGFIEGEDGKDYFFHIKSFRNKQESHLVSEESFIEFEQTATPKGYQAKSCSLLDSSKVLRYVTPEEFITSKSSSVRGWEIMEPGHWIVHGTSRNSPDAARKEVIDNACELGANAITELEYYKKTGSEAGTGRGTHFYTIHNFRAVPVTLAKKNANGKYKESELIGQNERARKLKALLRKKTIDSRKKAFVVWALIFILSLFFLLVAPVLIIPLLILGYFFGRSMNYDEWLEPKPQQKLPD